MKNNKPKAKGFAALSPEQRRRIASLGGKAAQASGKAHRYNHDEAVAAGRKGGKAAQERGTGFRWDSKTGKAASRKRRCR